MAQSGDDILAPAEWDSRCFGFPVARITAETAPATAVAEALARALRRGYRLVYWAGLPTRNLPGEVLQSFAGNLVDRKVTFRRDLTDADRDGPLRLPPDVVVTAFPRGPASAALVDLAIASGGHSRFRVDARFPPSAFEELYRTWIERSARGEIADAVLVVTPATDANDIGGMVTIAIEGTEPQCGRIGLIAVHARLRGRGLGGVLLQAAHQYMARRGCHRALVTTQLDNVSACRSYEHAGYVADTTRNIYHFWPLAS